MPGKRSSKDIADGDGELGTPGSNPGPGRPNYKIARMTAPMSAPTRKVNARGRGPKQKNSLVPETYDREFYVEHILDKRTIMPDGKIQYLVKWENYPVSQSTWEPEKHLTHAIGKVKHYEERKKAEAEAQIVRLEATAPDVLIGTDTGPEPKKVKKEHQQKRSTNAGSGRGRGKAKIKIHGHEQPQNPSPVAMASTATSSSSEATTPPIYSENADGGMDQLQESATPQLLHWVVLDPETMEEVKEPQAILGFVRDGEERSYVVKWKRSLDKELVPSAICREKFPELIIDYWENIQSN